MSIAPDDLVTIREWARGHADIAAVWLYGSVARGEADADSDIDLAVEMPFARWPDRPATWEAELRLSRPPHLEWYDPKASMGRVGPGVQRDGVLLYERGGK